MTSLIFVLDSRDYHGIDWYRRVREICPEYAFFIATDILGAEGEPCLLRASDPVEVVHDISRYLGSRKGRFWNVWRNLVRLVFSVRFIFGLRGMLRKHPGALFHAHSMYYISCCAFAGVRFIATPMGSDVLVRVDASYFTRVVTKFALSRAEKISVDSVSLMEKITKLTGKNSEIIQNGIDTAKCEAFRARKHPRTLVISPRGVAPNYRLVEFTLERNRANLGIGIQFFYPFEEADYRAELQSVIREGDALLGRLGLDQMLKIYSEALLVISVPISDSSPRSVYEAIFCGAPVVTVQSSWVSSLPISMRNRVIVTDISKRGWLEESLEIAGGIVMSPFEPCVDATARFDHWRSMRVAADRLYKVNVK